MKTPFKVVSAWAVIDPNGDLLHRAAGSPSIFLEKDTAYFLAYDWTDPEEKLEVIPVLITPLVGYFNGADADARKHYTFEPGTPPKKARAGGKTSTKRK